MNTLGAMDSQVDRNEFIRKFKKFVGSIKKITPEQWIRFKRWLEYIIMPKLLEEGQKEFENIIQSADIMEVEKLIMNLEVSVDNWLSKAKQEGSQEGLEIAAKALINNGKTIEEVNELLNLPLAVREKLEKKLN